jgi:hypothetical protein
VINLDGLANSPAFVRSELIGHLLYGYVLAETDPLREYLRAEQIAHLGNVDTIDREEYLGLVDAGHAAFPYEGDSAIFWGPGEPERRMIVAGIGRQ